MVQSCVLNPCVHKKLHDAITISKRGTKKAWQVLRISKGTFLRKITNILVIILI